MPDPAADTTSDTQVMERLRDGDQDALAVLVTRYQDELVGFFYHHCWNQTLAEDLAQTVFIKIYRARERYTATAKVRTYLYRIARNAWVDHKRREKHHVSLDAQGPSGGPSLADTLPASVDTGPAPDRDLRLRQRIQAAVDRLPAGQREVFMLANQQGLKYQEIAAVLGIPEGTVKSRMHAAVRVLRQDLADLIEETAP